VLRCPDLKPPLYCLVKIANIQCCHCYHLLLSMVAV
jgi:hypothetical protein